MLNIGIGIMCFGDKYYFDFTDDNLHLFLNDGLSCYVLTDNVDYFKKRYNTEFCNLLKYQRHFKSYHDKILLVKEILNYHDIAVIIDADVIIKNNSLIKEIKNYNYKKGITYIDTLKSHKCDIEFIRNIGMNPENIDWFNYRKFVENIYSEYDSLETIYEYFLVFNKDGINEEFYLTYEQLQIMKESCELMSKQRVVHGAAEGISTHIAAKVTNSIIQRDENLAEIIKNNMINNNRR